MIKILTLLFLLMSSPTWAFTLATGTYTPSGSDGYQVDISDTSSPTVADFQPDFVLVKCQTRYFYYKIATMPTDTSHRAVGSSHVFTDAIKTFNSQGFTLGTNGDVNTASQACFYFAVKGDANNDFAVGSYSGNSTDDRTIDISDTSTGSVPDFAPNIIILSNSTSTNHVKFWVSGLGGDSSAAWGSGAANVTNVIQGTNSNGFIVGNDAAANTTGNTYTYAAFKAVANGATSGNFTGNTSDDRDITGLGFDPAVVVVKGNSTTEASVLRTAANSGDESCRSTLSSCLANAIQGFITDGFQVGTHNSANENTVTMQWFALAQPTYATSSRRVAPIFFQ